MNLMKSCLLITPGSQGETTQWSLDLYSDYHKGLKLFGSQMAPNCWNFITVSVAWSDFKYIFSSWMVWVSFAGYPCGVIFSQPTKLKVVPPFWQSPSHDLKKIREMNINPLTPKTQLSVFTSSCCTFPCELVWRICCWVKTTTSTW